MSIVTRRSFVGAVAVAIAAGAGVTAEFVRHPRRSPHVVGSRAQSGSTGPAAPVVPPLLALALAREQSLLARLDETARATPGLRGRLAVLRADHRAHVAALGALITAAGATPPPTAPSAAVPSTSAASPSVPATSAPATSAPATSVAATSVAAPAGSVMSAAQVAALERSNAAAAGRDCPAATGSAAAVLASIYACEQTHVAWLG